MAGKDHYLILGVARSESPAGIRARYRDLVRALHPDVAGAASTAAFRAVTEAYEVLADPAARRRHNTELAAVERRPPIDSIAMPAAPCRVEAMSLLAERQVVRPSFDALVDRLFRNFTGIAVPEAERPKSLTFEVLLTPDEAARGAEVPIGVPQVTPCGECGGRGHVWLFPCVSCREAGVIATERVIRIAIPAGARSGAIIELALDGFGICNLYLRLCVWIE